MLLVLLAAATAEPSPADQAAIFKAAGFVQQGGAWKSGNCDGAESESYSPGTIETCATSTGMDLWRP